MKRIAYLACLFLGCVLLPSCVSTDADQSVSQTPASQPAGQDTTTTTTTTTVQQAGQASVAVPIQAPGWTGVAISEAMPLGLGVLMGMVILLSHRREMRRIACDRQKGLDTGCGGG